MKSRPKNNTKNINNEKLELIKQNVGMRCSELLKVFGQWCRVSIFQGVALIIKLVGQRFTRVQVSG